MMSSASDQTPGRLVRCSQGHVFDAASAACPFCGEARAKPPEASSQSGAATPAPPSTLRTDPMVIPLPFPLRPRTLIIAASTAFLLAVGGLAFLLMPAAKNDDDNGREGLRGRAEQNSQPDQKPAAEARPDQAPVQQAAENKPPPARVDDTKAQIATDASTPQAAPRNNPDAIDRTRSDSHGQPEKQASLDQGQKPPGQPSQPFIDFRDPIALAFEEKYALSPLARELLATSRGYYAYDRKEFWLAKAWFASDAAKNNPAANYWYGVMLQRGEGVQQDVAEGLRRITAAAQAGLYTAQWRLANIYLKGDVPGVAADPEKGKSWLMLAGKEERGEALKMLAELGVSHSDYEPTLIDLDRALGRSYDDAYKVASKLLEQKTTSGFLWVGNFTSFGNGVPADPVRGRELMMVAARLYAPAALINFANWSADGVRTSKNPVEAAALAYIARENAVFADEAQRIDKIIGSIVGMLTAEQYQDLGFLLKGIRTLPRRAQPR